MGGVGGVRRVGVGVDLGFGILGEGVTEEANGDTDERGEGECSKFIEGVGHANVKKKCRTAL
eukprot:921844-Ditylum_brightwellii.AAC.1